MVDHTKIIQCNIRDITERRKVEEKIEEMKKKLEKLVDIERPNLT